MDTIHDDREPQQMSDGARQPDLDTSTGADPDLSGIEGDQADEAHGTETLEHDPDTGVPLV